MTAHLMTTPRLLGSAVNLNQPGRYLHWSIFTVSEANLILIGVMVVLFGLALVVPFPVGRHRVEATTGETSAGPPKLESHSGGPPGVDDGASSAMWTARLRRRALRLLPPGKLLPDRQPAYVASWVYVFGVATLAALGLAILSGAAIALGGVDWWHTNPVGHFFNSRICGAWSCSWPSWSSTYGASSGWPPGEDGGP